MNTLPPNNGPQRVSIYESMFDHSTVVDIMCICPHCKGSIIYQHRKDTSWQIKAEYYQQRVIQLEEVLSKLLNNLKPGTFNPKQLESNAQEISCSVTDLH